VTGPALKLSSDRKVSPVSKWSNGNKRWEPMVPNAFGLLAGDDGGSCPGATDACKSVCYAARTERVFSSARRLVAHNLELLRAADGVDGMADLLEQAVGAFKLAHRKAEAKSGSSVPMVFRIHWDGDFFSTDYAEAWAQVIRSNSDVQFWAYTRSFGSCAGGFAEFGAFLVG